MLKALTEHRRQILHSDFPESKTFDRKMVTKFSKNIRGSVRLATGLYYTTEEMKKRAKKAFETRLYWNKKEKDIGETSEKIFNDCLEELAKVKEGIFEIKNSIPTMLDLINENVHKIKAENRFSWGQGIALMLSGAIVGALLSSFF